MPRVSFAAMFVSLSFALPMAVSPALAWDAGSLGCKNGACENKAPNTRHDGERRSTHLWIVDRAVDMLAQSGDPVAVRIAQKLRSADCRPALEEGIWKADEKPLADTVPGGQPGSHFYNKARRDWGGFPYNSPTYRLAAQDQTSHGNAKSNALSRLANARNLSTPGHCEELGLSLHYFTDLTQPMHTSGLMGFSGSPLSVNDQGQLLVGMNANLVSLHPAFEEYVGAIQGDVSRSDSWQKLWLGKTPGDVIDETSVSSNSKAPRLVNHLLTSPGECAVLWSGVASPLPPPFVGACFASPARRSENVRVIGEMLREGAQHTASYLYAGLADGANSQVAAGPVAYPMSRNEKFTLRGPDGKHLSTGKVSQSYWYATFGGSAQTHGFDGSGPLLSGQTVKLITDGPDSNYKQYNRLMAPKSGNACYYSYNNGSYEEWVIWKTNVGMFQGQRISDGDKIVLESKAYPGKVLRPYDNTWLGVGTFHPWTIAKR